MAGKTPVTKGYSSYTTIPAPQGDRDNRLKTPVNPYVVETKTPERARAPAAGHTNFYGSPTKFELLREYVYSPTMTSSPTYAPENPYDYKPNYGLNYGNVNPLVKNKNVLTPTKHILSSPVLGYSSEKSQRVHSQGLDPRGRGVLDNFSTRARPLEPKSQYERSIARRNNALHNLTDI